MARCNQCNVTIRDNTNICPLCQCVIEQDGRESDVYPDVWLAEKKMRLISNISLFSVLLVSAALAVINYVTGERAWCLIPIASLFYVLFVIRLVVFSDKGYRTKVIVPLITGILLVVLIDLITGPLWWSVNYVVPAGILLTDLIIVLMMLINKKRWQSYIVMEIAMIAVSAAILLLWKPAEVITDPVMSLVAFGISVFLFLGALIIGDRTARGELKRRFHIR